MSTNTHTHASASPTQTYKEFTESQNAATAQKTPIHVEKEGGESADSGGDSREGGRDGGSGDKIEEEGEIRYHPLG